MRNVARLPDSDRGELFRNTADKMGLNDAIVEKDFWVCFTLDHLFHRCPWKDAITFKGGTSLSKAFNLISLSAPVYEFCYLAGHSFGDWRIGCLDACKNCADRALCSNLLSKSFFTKGYGNPDRCAGADLLGKGDDPAPLS